MEFIIEMKEMIENIIKNIAESTPLLASFLAGIIFFFSGCFFPLYPTYLAYITGISVTSLREGKKTWAVSRALVMHSLCFVAGVSLIFYILGFGTSAAGSWFSTFWSNQQGTLRIIGGVVLILAGLIMAGVFQPTWLLRMQRHVDIPNRPVGYISSFLIGLGLVSGLSPCFMVAMGPIFTFMDREPDQIFNCMTLLSLGFGTPFLLFSFFLGWMKFLVRYTRMIQTIGGSIMVFLGLLLIVGKLHVLNY
ncbi:cytochrome c biogenesis CcdA family protein [Pasteuria penetrans]|uniref:cytochrome c biogenesis CcdA family protein n=1 Tax=Pasteuria penetrans TaxID=86005 RepID=UPI000F96D540|nr:cytochrome c biogenesis protein CcdA [Pasteuria penetrans]